MNGLVGTVLSDVLWLLSLLLTSPVVATVGLSLTIPIAMIFDFVLLDKTYDWLAVFGAVLVAMGFFLVNLDEQLVALCSRLVAIVRPPQASNVDKTI